MFDTSNATVKDLKRAAARLGLSVKAKALKVDLVRVVQEALMTVRTSRRARRYVRAQHNG